MEHKTNSNLVKFWKPANYSEIKAGTILRQRFSNTNIRYIFLEINAKGFLVLIPIYTNKNDGQKWETELYKMFAVAPDEEQIIKDFASFDLESFLTYCKREQS